MEEAPIKGTTKNQILICGAGICGLALGQYLKKYRSYDFEFDIIEKDIEFNSRSQGYSLTIQSNGQQALSDIDKIKELEKLVDAGEATRGRGQQHFDMKGIIAKDDGKKKPKYGSKDMHVYVPRQKLRDMLLSGVEENVKWSKWIERFEVVKGSDRIQVRLSSETDDKVYDCVVDCEGVFSQMRSNLLSNDLHYAGAVMFNGIVNNSVLYEEDKSYVFSGDNNTRLFLKPFSKGKIMWQLTLSADEGKAKELISLSVAEKMKIVKDVVKSMDNVSLFEMIAGTEESTFKMTQLFLRLPITHIDCSSLGLITLAGDAAHPMPPFKGQGANQALLDAVLLGRLLKKNQISDSLRVFERQMFKRANVLQEKSIEQFYKYHPKKIAGDVSS